MRITSDTRLRTELGWIIPSSRKPLNDGYAPSHAVGGSDACTVAVLTPSYGPDLELCRDLNRSVLKWTEPSVYHHIIVPTRDKVLFTELRGPRTQVWTVDELLPRRFVPVPRLNVWLNARRPYPPVRGWVMQQVVKLRAAAELGVDVLVLADSDVLLVRPVPRNRLCRDGKVRFYRNEGGVDEGMARHVLWHDAARRLLGLPRSHPPPLPDYISAFNVWDRRVVSALRTRIEDVQGRSWLDAIGSELHFSEFILYGVFVEEVLGTSAEIFTVRSTLCHSYWDPSPLTAGAATEFVRGMPTEDLAVMISAKSRTPLQVRRRALQALDQSPASDGKHART